MLIEEPAAEYPDVIIAVEDDRALETALRALKALRSNDLSADMIATGSPKKRYDKAAKVPAKVLVSFTLHGEKVVASTRSATASDEHARVKALLESLAAS